MEEILAICCAVFFICMLLLAIQYMNKLSKLKDNIDIIFSILSEMSDKFNDLEQKVITLQNNK